MAKGTRERRKSPSESGDSSSSSSDEPRLSRKPSKGRKKSTTRRTEAGPQKRRPIRRTSMPGAFPSDSDDDTLRNPSGRRYGRPQRAPNRGASDDDVQVTPHPRRQTGKARSSSPEDQPKVPTSRRPKKSKGVDQDDETAGPSLQPRKSPERSFEEQMRRAFALSLAQPASTRPSEEADEAAQMRWAMDDSTTHAEASVRPSSSANSETEYLRKLKESQDDHEALQRRRAQEAEMIRENEAYLARVLSESSNEVRASGRHHGELNEEDALKEALRQSMGTVAEDQRRADNRIRSTSRSWTENSPRAMERGEGPQARSSSSATPPASSSEPAANSPKAKPRKSKRLWSRAKKKKTVALDAVPEDTVATSSSPRPLRTGSSSGNGPQSENSQVVAIRKSKPIPEATSQALVELQEPPIKIETLIAMCERAFPQDGAVAQAMRDSQQSDYIYRVQYGLDDDEQAMSNAVALSLKDGPAEADISETGVTEGEEAPAYRNSAQDKVIDHFKYTSSDYRNEKAGTRKPITKEIWEIMRQYQDFLAWAKGIDPKGKSKEGQLTITPPTLPIASTTDSSAPAEVDSSLDETTRPNLREDFAVPNSEEVGHVMRRVDPKHRAAQRVMQNQSHAIGQSRLTGVRPRVRPEPYMSPFGRLPIMVEENEQVAEASRGQMAKSTARKVKRDANYRRSGI
ncbi:hypothetical protein XANCAGTX0491_005907 [Xanthoria calcicola]